MIIEERLNGKIVVLYPDNNYLSDTDETNVFTQVTTSPKRINCFHDITDERAAEIIAFLENGAQE